MPQLILVINTGNTSTKVGVFDGIKPVFVDTIRHADEELEKYHDINSQTDFRESLILDFLKEKEINVADLTAIAARGGLLRPVESGTYVVNEKMITDLKEAKRGAHASHLSAQIGYSIAQKAGITCYIVDPVSVDEYQPIARYSGHKLFERKMLTHALNMKAVAKRYAKENNEKYKDLCLIVVHLGTGVSVSIHKGGKMVDAINPSEEGCFSLDRSGGIPVLQAAQYIIDNELDYKTFSKILFGNGGMQSYLQSKDFLKISEKYNAGDKEVIGVVDAMAYQIAKEVGSMATVNFGKVDKILLTGGMAYSEFFVEMIKKRVGFIAPIALYPGEDEMEALAEGIFRVLDKEEEPRIY
ncbi:MAG: butyrate kinase [bacterium]|nr:butyrate kinase [bacterium]